MKKKTKKYIFQDYLNASKDLLKLLFGKELYDKLANTPLKAIDWKGLDITCPQILAVTHNIKENLGKKQLQYHIDKGHTLLDLYLQSIFHYGFQQHYDSDEGQRELLDLLKNIKNKINGE